MRRATQYFLLWRLVFGLLLTSGAILSASAADGATPVATTPAPITSVIELFTSQGCSSCPPADALMKSYVATPGVLALSFNVDIWDNLGWKDTLASPQYTQRQREYARSRGDGQVYTPQTIINGLAHAVGSDRPGIDAAIKATKAAAAMHVALSVTTGSNGLEITAPASSTTTATLWLVKFTPKIEIAIRRGENTGRTITYYNVVGDFKAIGAWTGAAATIKVGQAALAGCTPGTCAILLQQGGTGGILGATWVPGQSGI